MMEQLPLFAPTVELPPCPACGRHRLRVNGFFVHCPDCPWIGCLYVDNGTPRLDGIDEVMRQARVRKEVLP